MTISANPIRPDTQDSSFTLQETLFKKYQLRSKSISVQEFITDLTALCDRAKETLSNSAQEEVWDTIPSHSWFTILNSKKRCKQFTAVRKEVPFDLQAWPTLLVGVFSAETKILNRTPLLNTLLDFIQHSLNERISEPTEIMHTLVELIQKLSTKELKHMVPMFYKGVKKGLFTDYHNKDLINLLRLIDSSTFRKLILTKVDDTSDTLQGTADLLKEEPIYPLRLGGELRNEIYEEIDHRNNAQHKLFDWKPLFLRAKIQMLRITPINHAIINSGETLHPKGAHSTSDATGDTSLGHYHGTLFIPPSKEAVDNSGDFLNPRTPPAPPTQSMR